MNYYRIIDNLDYPKNRWFLGSINFENDWDFWEYVKSGIVRTPKKKLFISLRKSGVPIDFTMADFELLIVNDRIISLLNKDEVQYISVYLRDTNTLLSTNTILRMYLMCITHEIDCVDEKRSVYDRWDINDPIRPDYAGKYKTFYKLFIDPSLTQKKNIFRIKDYNSIIVVSEEIKHKFESNNITGVLFKQVT